jgi:rod shape determining protein RodA
MIDWRGYLRHLDYLLLLATAGLVVYGVTMIYFATHHDIDGAPFYYVRQQLIAVAVGLLVALVVSVLDYELYRRFQWLLYAVAVLIVVAVLPLGENVNGATRWINLGVTRFQPSAAAVLLLALSIAAFLSDRMELLGSKRITLIVLALAAVPAFFVYREPDFGSAMVIVVLALAMLYFYGTPWTHFAVLGATGITAFVVALKVLPMAGVHLIQQYQIDRLFVFINPGHNAQGTGYNVIQSMIAVGSGALTGRGNMATQTTLDFLPEHHTDFIFAVISERNGFLGATVLLVLYALFIWRALRIAILARDMYGFQVFVNIGMTIGIMPVTGIPLPFISYGGTAMIAFLILVGLLQAIHLRATITPQTRGRLGQ